MKLRKYYLFASLIFPILSCQNANPETDKRRPYETIDLASKQVNSPTEDAIEHWLRQPSHKYKNNFSESLLHEKSKFHKMASACFEKQASGSNSRIPIHGEISPPLQLETNVYLIQLTCAYGRGANVFSWFIYQPQQGIQTDALKLSTVSVNESGKSVIKESTSIFIRNSIYDAAKKEMVISVPCHQADGHIASRTIYKYKNRNFVLAEYWQDDTKNRACLQNPKLRRFYP
jgi:hypothetical protein